jgi:hypothetical protein
MAENSKSYAQSAAQLGCFAHPHTGAVAQCATCSRGLCPGCAKRFEPPMCDGCLVQNNSRAERGLWTGLMITAGIALVSPFILRSLGYPLVQSILMGFQFAFVRWGWKFLTVHLPGLARSALAIWFVYFLFKLVASMFVGLVVGPYRVFRSVTQLRVLRHAKAVVSANPAGSERSDQELAV